MVCVTAASWSVITGDGTRKISAFARIAFVRCSAAVTAYDPPVQLRDRHVVVTGAAGGIGSALARRFHADGARVVLTDLDGADEVSSELPGSLSIAADQTERGRDQRHDRRRRGSVRAGRSVLRQRRRGDRHRPDGRRARRGSWRSPSTSTPTAGRRGGCCRAGWSEARATSARPPRQPACWHRSARRPTASPSTPPWPSPSGCRSRTAITACA